MNIKYAIQGDIDRESAQNVLAVSSQLARSLEGQTTIKTIEIDSAKAIIKVNVDTAFIVIIVSALTGVIFHPRSGSIEMLPYTEYISGPFGSMPETKYLPGVAGGWRDGKTELTTEYIYPLVDEDNASFLVSKEDNEEELLGEFLGEDGNYGNLYWWNGDEEEPVFLSWKGTPARHFRLPSNIDIPGFSTFETSIPGAVEDTPVYTPFGTKLYQDGIVLAESPKWSWPYNPSGVGGRCLILGACQSTDGSIYIVTQSDHYNAPENVFIFSDGHREEGPIGLKQTYLSNNPEVTCIFEKALTNPGFFLTLWKMNGPVDGWSFISEHSYTRSGLPFFANTNGTSFVSTQGDVITTSGRFTGKVGSVGSYSEEGPYTIFTGSPFIPAGTKIYNVGNLTFSANYNDNFFYEYNRDSLVYGNIDVRVKTNTITHYSDRDVVDTSVFDYYHDDSIPIELWVGSFDDILNVGSLLEIGGGGLKGPYKLITSGFTVEEINGYYVVTSLSACSPGVIRTGTAYAEDGCGTKTGIYTFKLYGGSWVTSPIVYSVAEGLWGAGTGTSSFTVINGDTKRFYTYSTTYTNLSTPSGVCCIPSGATPYLLPNEWSAAANVVLDTSCITTGSYNCTYPSRYIDCDGIYADCPAAPGVTLITKRQFWSMWRSYVESKWRCL